MAQYFFMWEMKLMLLCEHPPPVVCYEYAVRYHAIPIHPVWGSKVV